MFSTKSVFLGFPQILKILKCSRRITFHAPESSLFSVDISTGDVRTKATLDYENGVTTHHLRILANTSSNTRLSLANLQILTEGQDEYAPQVVVIMLLKQEYENLL